MLTYFGWAGSFEHSVKIIYAFIKTLKQYVSCITSDIIVGDDNRFILSSVWY